MTSIHGKIFKQIDKFLFNFKQFCFENHELVELFFIIVYALEQVLLIWGTIKWGHSDFLISFISLFVVLILTTFAIQKLAMTSRMSVLEDDVQALVEDKIRTEEALKIMTEKYRALYEDFVALNGQTNAQDLNRRKTIQKSRGSSKK